MADQQPPHFITRPHHRSLDQQIAAIFEAAAKWSAEALSLADQAQLLLASDRTLADAIRNLHDLYGQPPNRIFVLVPARNKAIVAAFAVLADRGNATVDIRHLTISFPYREMDIKSVLLPPIEHLARQDQYQHIVSTVYPHQHEIIKAFHATGYLPTEFDTHQLPRCQTSRKPRLLPDSDDWPGCLRLQKHDAPRFEY